MFIKTIMIYYHFVLALSVRKIAQKTTLKGKNSLNNKPKKLLDILVNKIRLKHYSKSTEKTYLYWSRNYILFHNKQHPKIWAK